MHHHHIVTAPPDRRPAHAARPGLPAERLAAILIGLAALTAAGWMGGLALLESAGPATSEPVSASQMTMPPASTAARP